MITTRCPVNQNNFQKKKPKPKQEPQDVSLLKMYPGRPSVMGGVTAAVLAVCVMALAAPSASANDVSMEEEGRLWRALRPEVSASLVIRF